MGKDIHGWVQISYDGENWLNAVALSSILFNVDVVSTRLFDEGGLLANHGLPDDVHRARHEPWIAKEFQLEGGFGHTWFDWEDISEVLCGAPRGLENFAYRSDPEFVDDVAKARQVVRDAIVSGDDDGQWRLLLAVVEPLVARFGPLRVRGVVWFIW
jgi:hypothetical protein